MLVRAYVHRNIYIAALRDMTCLHMFMHKHKTPVLTFRQQPLSSESSFQAGSKNLCLANAALEQISLFGLPDFGL